MNGKVTALGAMLGSVLVGCAPYVDYGSLVHALTARYPWAAPLVSAGFMMIAQHNPSIFAPAPAATTPTPPAS